MAKDKNGGATVTEGRSFRDFNLSLPQFRAGESVGPVQGFILNILGPFNPGKNATIKQPWYAYQCKATAEVDCVDIQGEHVKVMPGDLFMLPISAQLRNIASFAVDDKRVWEWRFIAGASPKPGAMRVWKAQQGRCVDRGADFPLMLPGKREDLFKALPVTTSDTTDESETAPF